MTLHSRPHRLALAGMALMLGLAACSPADELAAEPAEPSPAPTAQEQALTATLPDPTDGLTTTGWIDGSGAFAGLPLADTELDAWPDLLVDLPASESAPFTLTTRVERDPDACTVWRVLIEDIDLGQGDAAERMRTTVLDTLTGIDHDPGPLLGPDDEPWCGDRPREGLTWYATTITPSFCALPDAASGTDALTCLTVTTMRYDGGAHPNTVHTDLVFDVATGESLDVAALLATRELALNAVTAFIESTVCDLDLAAEMMGAEEGCWPIVLRNARPTPSGLILSFAPYESGPYAFGPRDLFVPWTELDAGGAVPAATRATDRELRTALASGDWSLVDALVPADDTFLVATGEESADPVAVLRALPRDPRPEMLVALAQRPGRVDGMTVWPELALRDPFTIDASERQSLETAFGVEAIAAWESAGRYLGWRAGIDDDGVWRFIVAGD